MKSLVNITRIVFYGCSFTVGSELSDCELMPLLSKEEIDKLKIKEQYSFYERFDRNIITQMDNKKSWARWLADELKLPWINRAKGGASMGEIVFLIEQDLALGKILETDMIVVGITSPERICTFQNYGTRSYIMNDLDTSWDKKFRNEFILNIADDNYIVYNWYKDIKYLDLLSARLGGRLCQQWIWSSLSELFQFNKNGKYYYNIQDYLKDIIHENVIFNSIIDDNISFTKLNAWAPENREVLCHPKLSLHKEIAIKLSKSFVL